MSNNVLMQIKDLHVDYTAEEDIIHAVNGISLTIRKGESLGLVGETGAGKTTTVLSILKLLPKYASRVSKGEILFHNEDLLQADEDRMRDIRGKQISMIFQDPMTSLNPVLRIGDQIGEVIRLHDRTLTASQVDKQVQDILTLVGIPPERRREFPHQFSGGMKQRVIIAIAIACRPELLIADEPTSALDVTIQAQVIDMMRELRDGLGSSVILITHDLGVVANFCDTVAIMYAGEIVEYGKLEQIFDRSIPHHPYTVGLFGAIPDVSRGVKRLSPIPGLMPNPANLPKGCKFSPRCSHCTDRCTKGRVPVVMQNGHRIKCHVVADQIKEASI